MSIAVGIDLGTTNSCVAIYRNGEVEIIENAEEEPTTPSFVYYDDDGTIVGKDAEARAVLNTASGVYDSKRMLGHKFDDKEIQDNLTTWPFKVTQADNGEPQIEIEQNGKIFNVRPEEVSAEILKNLKKYASRALDEDITNAVITVPAYFSNPQRQATKDAAKMAGLNVLKLINEPTAAAFALIVENEESKNQTVLVYDLGGGTFDVSVISFQNKNNVRDGEVLSISGDTHLGGRDFDNNLLSYFLNEIETRYMDLPKNKMYRRNIRRIRYQCENVKKTLSENSKATLFIEQFLGPDTTDLEIIITRDEFEKINEKLFAKTIQIVDDVLRNANVTQNQIDEVLLVGGSTRIPKIQQLVRNYFQGKTLNKRVNPDEAVARGAAIQAAFLNDSPDEKNNKFSLTDVTPFSLGIEVTDDKFSAVIERNTKTPVSKDKEYMTVFDSQTSVSISVYEGESENVHNNIFLGEFYINDMTPLPKGEVKIIVKFEMDSDGILNVTASESSKNLTKDLNIVLNNGRFSDEQIKEIRARLETNDGDSD